MFLCPINRFVEYIPLFTSEITRKYNVRVIGNYFMKVFFLPVEGFFVCLGVIVVNVLKTLQITPREGIYACKL